MGNPHPLDKAQQVQDMFGRIAKRYDLMNCLMTAGQDTRWRREVIRKSRLKTNGQLLDLGAGTGDLAQEAFNQVPGCTVTAADFTLEMMRVGKSHFARQELNWTAADALHLPFRQENFDAVVSGFLLRNVADIMGSLREQLRVLKPGGVIVVLDTTRPAQNKLRPLIDFYLHVIIPNLGKLIAGDAEAYTYLPETTESFLSAEQLAAHMEESGLKQVAFKRLMFGTIAIHWGMK